MGSIRVWAMTDVGLVKETNEDSFAFSGYAEGGESFEWQGEIGKAWAIVADGIGGQVGGEVASRLAIDFMQSILPAASSEVEAASAIQVTNIAVYTAMDLEPSLKGLGTTIAGVLIDEKHVTLTAFNVGDSRIYARVKGRFERLSVDHVIDSALTQCLGGAYSPNQLHPHILTIDLDSVTRVLICTDGLTRCLDDEIIESMIYSDGNPANNLVRSALSAGGYDNITAIVIDFRG